MSASRLGRAVVATLGALTVAAVAYLAVAAASPGPKNTLLQAAERPSPPPAAAAPPPPKAARPAGGSPAPAGQPPGPGGPTLRVATWNVRDCAAWDAASGERIALHDYVAGSIKAAAADVIVLEEIQADGSKGGDIALLSVALARAGWAMPYVAVVDAKGEDDLAVFSRYKIDRDGPVLEPGAAGAWPRPGIFASVEAEGGKLDLYGFHFKAMGDAKSASARRAQAEALGDYLRATYGAGLPKAAIVVAGDFNIAADSDLGEKNSTLSALRLTGDGDPANDFTALNDRFRRNEPTFVDSRYSSVLDHILVSPALAAGLGPGS
ncbi:endonuclease/exonuclease/phosphatase family protein, partial [bacterium]|nr:endonuclease/exonuclease/phosphatase family protein [bacterium]